MVMYLMDEKSLLEKPVNPNAILYDGFLVSWAKLRRDDG